VALTLGDFRAMFADDPDETEIVLVDHFGDAIETDKHTFRRDFPVDRERPLHQTWAAPITRSVRNAIIIEPPDKGPEPN
jgi:hypothetical protein